MSLSKNILFFISGSVACYKAIDVLSQLKKMGHNIKVLATPDTLEFIGKSTIEGITGAPPFINTFEPNQNMAHIDLGKWCDVAVICPATANTLNKISAGIADNLVTSTLLAFDYSKPLLIFPAMNSRMLAHPATQKSLRELQSWGATTHLGSSGELACGEVGPGRLLEPLDIINCILESLTPQPQEHNQNPQTIAISYGGTIEPIDSVRFITNFSTGRTGYNIVKYLVQLGHHVIALHAHGAPILTHSSVENIGFTSHQDLLSKTQTVCRNNILDLFIQAAAISDYSVDSINAGSPLPLASFKISSEHESLHIKMKKNSKILDQIKGFCKQPPQVVGFKLTDSNSVEDQNNKVKKLFSGQSVDLVVHNDINEIKNKNHKFSLFSPETKLLSSLNITEIVDSILNYNPPAIQEMAPKSPESKTNSVPTKLLLKNPSRFEVTK